MFICLSLRKLLSTSFLFYLYNYVYLLLPLLFVFLCLQHASSQRNSLFAAGVPQSLLVCASVAYFYWFGVMLFQCFKLVLIFGFDDVILHLYAILVYCVLFVCMYLHLQKMTHLCFIHRYSYLHLFLLVLFVMCPKFWPFLLYAVLSEWVSDWVSGSASPKT